MTNNAGPFWNVQLEAYPLYYKIYPVQVECYSFLSNIFVGGQRVWTKDYILN
ncbi:hypothetical protein DEO72_LG9g3217 [Vigna unguiculata]|uniref:Uncharacterized protein n=1 Tax=Vigna unguiculata TaxID=3917 RepID=A0A4D6N325_VIGUN|nr:hypothetical protein DEO72_LG9g3217 [Vigna unguiculata]